MLQTTQKLCALAALLALNACAAFTLPGDEVTSLKEVSADQVLLVGKLTLNPPLKETEKNIDVPYDFFGSAEMMSNRAILGFNENASVKLEKSGFLINPELGKTFFYAVPKNRVNMIGGYITVSYSLGTTINHGKVLVPPLKLDIRAGDEIVYIGTLHLERGPFNDVTSATISDDYNSARAELANRFGTTKSMRKALPAK